MNRLHHPQIPPTRLMFLKSSMDSVMVRQIKLSPKGFSRDSYDYVRMHSIIMHFVSRQLKSLAPTRLEAESGDEPEITGGALQRKVLAFKTKLRSRAGHVLRVVRPKHVRTRLTVWYVFVLAGVLLLAWTFTASFLFLQLRSQLTHYAIQDVETVEGLLYFDAAGRLMMRKDYHNHLDSERLLERLLEIRSPDGAVLYRNDRLGDRALGGIPFAGEGVDQFSPRSTRLADGTPVRMVSRYWTLQHRPLMLRLAYSEEPIRAHVEELAWSSVFALPIALAVAGLGGYLMALRALKPLEVMARRAGEITSERLHERLPSGEVNDELGQLARAFNNLLGRLEQSFAQLRRFTADASHELRTPLALLRSVGEVAIQKGGGGEAYCDAIGSMLEEVNRLTALVDGLLTISRADAGSMALHPVVFRAMDLAHEAAGMFEVLAEEKGQRIVIEGDEESSVLGDRVFLAQALANIVHNAVKYSPPGGEIRVEVRRGPGGEVFFDVLDDGPGIAPEHAPKIFNRFYRVDDSRSRHSGGAGLGLSIAQWAVQVHSGDIHLLSTPGKGCVFSISLPPVGRAGSAPLSRNRS
jgi:heavy metal sensor kinase